MHGSKESFAWRRGNRKTGRMFSTALAVDPSTYVGLPIGMTALLIRLRLLQVSSKE
ncbi:MAG: hypothetical protein ACI82F_003525 [Planctomycetota bacterium]|jgi:hypothetical protein